MSKSKPPQPTFAIYAGGVLEEVKKELEGLGIEPVKVSNPHEPTRTLTEIVFENESDYNLYALTSRRKIIL